MQPPQSCSPSCCRSDLSAGIVAGWVGGIEQALPDITSDRCCSSYSWGGRAEAARCWMRARLAIGRCVLPGGCAVSHLLAFLHSLPPGLRRGSRAERG